MNDNGSPITANNVCISSPPATSEIVRTHGTHQWQHQLTAMTETILEAGSHAVQLQKEAFTTSYKAARDLVTTADTATEALIIEKLTAATPEATFLAEESSGVLSETEISEAPSLWVIDPIDGTTNFAFSQPQFSVSIAYAEKGLVRCGAVYAPRLGELYTAVQGAGAAVNGVAVAPATPKESLKQALIAVGRPCNAEEEELFFKRLHKVFEHCLEYRRPGSGAIDLCWVGLGRVNGFFETLQPWDIAAGLLFAKETGCDTGHIAAPQSFHTTHWDTLPADLDGREILVTSPGLFEALKSILVV